MPQGPHKAATLCTISVLLTIAASIALSLSLPPSSASGLQDSDTVKKLARWSTLFETNARAVVIPQPRQNRYVVTDLGTLGGNFSVAYAINNSGQIAGYSLTANGSQRAFLYTGGVMKDLGTLGGNLSQAFGINDLGQVTGFSFVSANPNIWHPFIYTAGSMIDLGTLGGPIAVGLDINDAGQVTGASRTGDLREHAFFYSGGVMHDLGTIGIDQSIGYAINSRAQITGESQPFAFLSSDGVMRNLGTLRGGAWSTGRAINDLGQVAGFSATSAATHAFLYTGGVLNDLGTLGGPNSMAYGLNEGGEVVGESQFSRRDHRYHAFRYFGGKMVDVNPEGWSESVAYGINNRGQIVGSGINPEGFRHAFLLSPFVTYYYGLGDSVASGHGLPDDSGAPCHQSRFSYPRLVAQQLESTGVVDRGPSVDLNGELHYFGCSGASTGIPDPSEADRLLRNQVESVVKDLRSLSLNRESSVQAIVSITAGANDFPWSPSPDNLLRAGNFFCQSRADFEGETNEIARSVRLSLVNSIRHLQVRGKVFVVLTTYHNPFNRSSYMFFAYKAAGGCSAISDDEMYARSEYLVHTLNEEIRRVVTQHGLKDVAYAEMHDGPDGFHGHESPRGIPGLSSCGASGPDFAESWIQAPLYSTDPVATITQGFLLAKGDCFHPNPQGASVYANHVASAIRALLSL